MPSSLSLRAERALKANAPYYFDRMLEAIADAWTVENPDGFIMAAVAENGASSHIILERMQSHSEASTIPQEVMMYNDAKGWWQFREVLCSILQRTSMHGLDVAPENLAISAGVASVLDHLSFLLADKGSSCLIPAPFYPVFPLDLSTKAEVDTVPINLGPDHVDSEVLDKAFLAQETKRRPVRAVLITNPDNPTGQIMSEDRLKAIMRWCCRKRVHCIVDEIYALSVFPGEQPLRSAIVLASEVAAELHHTEVAKLWEHVHVVTGLSKDFCASGLRVGGLYTYNSDLVEVYGKVAPFSTVSHLTQWTMMEVLKDDAFVDSFIQQNAEILAHNAKIVTDALERMQVEYKRPRAGFFVWASLRKRLGIDTFEREREIFNALFQTAKVYVVPGQCCHALEPGHYRICFASHPAEAIEDMMARIQHFIDQYKVKNAAQSWNTQTYMLAAGFGSRKM